MSRILLSSLSSLVEVLLMCYAEYKINFLPIDYSSYIFLLVQALSRSNHFTNCIISEKSKKHKRLKYENKLFLSALGDIARARNMSQLSRETGMSREGLYHALSGEGNPTFSAMMKITKALNNCSEQ